MYIQCKPVAAKKIINGNNCTLPCHYYTPSLATQTSLLNLLKECATALALSKVRVASAKVTWSSRVGLHTILVICIFYIFTKKIDLFLPPSHSSDLITVSAGACMDGF